MLKKIIILSILLIGLTSYAKSMYVTSDDLNVRLSPSKYSKKTSVLLKGQKVDVYEINNGWARISKYYDGYLEGVNEKVARWVNIKYLSNNEPKQKEINSSSPIAKEIENSDDFEKYYESFISISEKLVQDNICTLKDYRDEGGWMRSTTKGKGIYFTYCGGMKLSNKIYINVLTGKYFR